MAPSKAPDDPETLASQATVETAHFIGDTERDATAAERAGVDYVDVSA